jgi:hypothetical protein
MKGTINVVYVRRIYVKGCGKHNFIDRWKIEGVEMRTMRTMNIEQSLINRCRGSWEQ